MVAGLVLFSAAVGLVAMVAALVLSVPLWIALSGYPVLCSLTLLLAATISGLRTTDAAGPVLHPQT